MSGFLRSMGWTICLYRLDLALHSLPKESRVAALQPCRDQATDTSAGLAISPIRQTRPAC